MSLHDAFRPYVSHSRASAAQFWRARTGDGPIARAFWTLLALVLAIPIAIIVVAFLLLLIGLAIALALLGIVRRSIRGWLRGWSSAGDASPERPVDTESGRENVRVVRRPHIG